MKKSVISLMLVLAFLLSALSPSAWAASSPQAEYYAADNTSENPTDTGKFVEMWSKAATSGGTVKLLQDVTMPTAQWGVGFYEQYGTVFVPSGKTITLDLNDCTLDRGLTTSKTSGGVIRVEGILTLKDGSSNKGGTITGGYSSSGGGIYIKDGTLNMQGGKISNNHATGDGGGVCVATGTFNLSGGEISGNTSSGTTGGSGGIYNYQGIVNMTGGTITNNTSSYHGGGIHNCKTLSISGGLIQDNTTTHYGGGVFFAGGSCNISGTPQITNNSNKDGTNNVQSYSSTPQISQLREGASIGFSRRPASDSDPISIARTADRNGETYLKYFFADDSENYHIVWNETYYQFQLASGPVPHTHYLNVNCQANTEGVVGYSPTTFEHRLSTDENGALLVDGQKKRTGSHSLSYPAFGVVGYELEPGSYYLESDCKLDHPIIFCTNGEMLNLCLNGHTIFPKDPGSIRGSLIYACKTGSGASDSVGFNLCDCSTGETGAVTGGNANGSGELNNGGGIYVHAGETGFFRMFSGNITGNKAAGNGGGIYSVRARNSNGSTVIYGGTVSGNTAGGNGGGIYSCLDDKFELKGGIISRNEATGQNGNGDGGGIYSLGLFYMYDGEVSGNTAAGTGGGLFLNGQNYSDIQEHIWAGEIKNNTAQTGGGIALTNRKLDITTGSVGTGKCKITGNNASDSGAGISVDTTSKLQLNGTGMEISGNKLTGTGSGFGAGVDVQGTISLSGTPVVYNNTDAQNAQNNLYLRSDKTVDFVSSLSSGAKIGITKPMPEDGTTYVQISSIRANSSYAGYFTADNPAYEVIWTEAYKYLILALKGTAPHIHALNVGCQAAKDAGVGGETVTFSRLTSNNRNQLQADNITVSNNTLTTGNYYVASDLTLATEIKITGDVNLCLNGHVITSAPNVKMRMFNVQPGATLSICDCDPTHENTISTGSWPYPIISGGVITGGKNIDFGAGILLYGSEAAANCASLVMYSGSIAYNSAQYDFGCYGGGVCMSNYAKFDMYGGCIQNNSASYQNTLSPCFGGGVAMRGTNAAFRMLGGEISGNSASGSSWYNSEQLRVSGPGGGVYVGANNKFYMGGNARITNNIGKGGGVYVDNGGEFHLTQGSPQICNNTMGKIHNDGPISNAYLYRSTITIDDSLSDGIKIGITTEPLPQNEGVQITGNTNINESYVNYLVADDSENYHVAWNGDNGYLELRKGKAEVSHTHNTYTFTALSTLSSSLSPGSYYLTGDITLTDTISISGSVNLCLNGHTITGPTGKAAFQVPNGAALNVYNEEGAGSFAGLSGSGGIEVAGGGTLKLFAQDGSTAETYAPAASGSGGKVTVDESGTVTKPGSGGTGGGEETGTHKDRHPAYADATEINASNFNSVTETNAPSGYSGALPEHPEAYRFLNQGKYYLEGNFKMPNALIVTQKTDFCLNGSNLGADNDTWIYEMQHVFWVPEKTVLNVEDCQRDLHIIWLYGGRVFLKGGAQVSISGKVPNYITQIKMADGSDGEVKVEYVDGKPVMTLPDGATLTQKMPDGATQTITKKADGSLTMTANGKTTTVTPPAGKSVGLTLPETPSGGGTPPAITLEAPAGSTVQTGSDPVITLEQPGEVAPDGTVSSPEVTVTNPATGEEITVTAPNGKVVTVDPDGTATVPEGGTIQVGDVVMEVTKIPGSGTATVTPDGKVTLPADSQVSVSNPKKESATIVIALPGGGSGGGTISLTDKGVKPPQGSNVSAKPRESVTIVIALPYPQGGGDNPEIKFSGSGGLIVPKDSTVTKGSEPPQPVTEGKNILNPDTGELSGPVNPNTPSGTPTPVTPDTPVENDKVKVEMDPDTDEIKVTPKEPTKPSVVIKPQPQEPGDPAPQPKVDDNGKVFLDTPFTVEPADGSGPAITADNGGSVDPEGNVTGETVTVEQKKPDGTTESKTTLTAPEDDAVKVDSKGNAHAPVGTEIEQGNIKVQIDRTPYNQPVQVNPKGETTFPSGSKATVTSDNGSEYSVTMPQGGDVKIDPDTGKVTLPPNTVVTDPDNPNNPTTIGPNGGTLNPATGVITGGVPGGSNPGGNTPGGNNPGSNPGGTPGGNNPGSNPGSNPGGNNPGSSSGGGSDGEDEDEEENSTITASASIGGKVTPGKRVPGDHGDDQTFTITPDEGYVIQDVLVDGKSVGPVTSYIFKNVRGRHTIQALFVAEGMLGTGIPGGCPKDVTCPIWPYKDSIPTKWYHDGVHYCIENKLMIGTGPVSWEPDIPLTRGMMAQVLYNKAGKPAVSGAGVFDDVEQEWYWPAITWGGRNSVLLGYGDGNFGPRDPITREQLATLLWRYSGQPQVEGKLRFTDKDQVSGYAEQALLWASQHGIILGYPDGTFRPRDNASRAEAAQMIMRYFEL